VEDDPPRELIGAPRTAFDDLAANFRSPTDQGPAAYASQMLVDHPGLSEKALRADAVLAVDEFYQVLFPSMRT